MSGVATVTSVNSLRAVAECPVPGCGGTIVQRSRSYGCNSWDDPHNLGCGYVIWKRPSGSDREATVEGVKARIEADRAGTSLRSDDYRAYINGSIPGWHEKRAERLRMDDGLCVLCTDEATQVHHVTYDRLGIEDMDDLRSLCASCHAQVHSHGGPTGRMPQERSAVTT